MRNIEIRLITDADNSVIAEIIRTNLKKFHLDIPGTAYFDSELDCLSKYYSDLPEKRAYFIAEGDNKQIVGGVGVAEFENIDCCAEIQKALFDRCCKRKWIGKNVNANGRGFCKEEKL